MNAAAGSDVLAIRCLVAAQALLRIHPFYQIVMNNLQCENVPVPRQARISDSKFIYISVGFLIIRSRIFVHPARSSHVRIALCTKSYQSCR
eukprot:836522-Pleurochrysis_carterae.AAC.1